eukprot:701244-Karenia_brevis.AAC.1
MPPLSGTACMMECSMSMAVVNHASSAPVSGKPPCIFGNLQDCIHPCRWISLALPQMRYNVEVSNKSLYSIGSCGASGFLLSRQAREQRTS